MNAPLLLWGLEISVTREQLFAALSELDLPKGDPPLVAMLEPGPAAKGKRRQQWFGLLGPTLGAAQVLDALVDAFARVNVLIRNDDDECFSLQCFERTEQSDRCLLAAEWRDQELVVHGDNAFGAEVEEAEVGDGEELLEMAIAHRFGTAESERVSALIETMIPHELAPGAPPKALTLEDIADHDSAVDWEQAMDLWYDFGDEGSGSEEDDDE